MSEPARIRRTRILREAEGYLDLVTAFGERWPCREDYRQQLCSRVLEILARIDNPGGLAGEIAFLRGQALKAAGLYGEAVHALQAASELDPANVHVFLALAWCYKRSRRIDMAIQSLEAALEVDPDLAILHYNLACYWSLAGNAKYACSFLAQAFELEPNYRDHVATEADFDPVRHHPHFCALTAAVV